MKKRDLPRILRWTAVGMRQPEVERCGWNTTPYVMTSTGTIFSCSRIACTDCPARVCTSGTSLEPDPRDDEEPLNELLNKPLNKLLDEQWNKPLEEWLNKHLNY